MKYFIYTYHESKPKNGAAIIKTVNVYQIHRNVPKQVCSRTDTFVSETQLVLEALEEQEALSPKAFAKNPNSGSMVNGTFSAMEAARFAKIFRIN